ncbi:MAG: tRNA (N6-isopentenyl adenosine(37)-C2)-methylthiotransferase MiaB, partial [Erysipelotrichaceae bacterium]|nr:tRNA (N6-isopentenyl adenosine(37)-C2)-methylthiotransferase MiaB [Erysipelotrichaceae bacterium]
EVLSQEGDLIEELPVRRSAGAKGFVHIMYGCDKFCTYCIVPYTRGRERSRRREDILAEIRSLREEGRKEAVLLGQNVNAYGKDLGMEDGFTSLLESAAETGIERIRFYTSHPRDYSATTIDAMRKYPNIMKSLHLPVQSGSDEILKRMNRGYTADSYRKLYDDMRAKIPEITFTTDLIVGFPGETDEQFQATLDLVDYCQFDLAYSFVYSPRAGTPAARMEDSIPAEVKKERLQILNDRLSAIAATRNAAYLGRKVRVLCEGPSKKNAAVYSGYSEENKLVNFTGPEGLEDRIVDVEITETHSFSLDGKAV